MFAIANDRKSLWQWDLNQQLTVAGDCTEVHYLDKGAPSTLTVAVKDGKADIPNILLQKAGRLVVYAYIIDAQDHHTKVCETFGIAPRPKPTEYVYTETEVKTWSDLQSQIGDLDNLVTEKKNNLVAAINEAAQSGGGGAGSGSDISLGLTSAAVGQTIKVKAVDESGKPTEWEAADMPSGGGAGLWEHICDITATEEIDGGITISENREGVSLSELQYNEIWVLAKMVGVSTNTNNWWGCTCGVHQNGGNQIYRTRTNGASSGKTNATRYVSWYTFIRGGKAYWTDGANIDPYDMAGGNQAWLDNFLDQNTFDYFTDVAISSDSTRVIGVDTEIRILGRRA